MARQEDLGKVVGADGAAANIIGATVAVDNNTGVPEASVVLGGSAQMRTFAFNFKNLKGEKGDKGDPGDAGGGSPVEFLKVWDCPDGDARLELWAAAVGGLVAYYAILTGTFSKNNYSHDNTSTSGTKDGEMVNLFEADPKFLPVLSETDDDVQSVTLNGIVGVDDGKATAISILLINSAGTGIQTVGADLTGHTLLHLGTIIFLGMCKSQAAQPSTLAARASAPTPDVDPAQIYDALYPVGSIKLWYDNADHSTFLGMTWERCPAGRAPVGINPSEAEFASIGQTGGEKTHALTTAEIPPYSSQGFSSVESSRNPRIESFNGNGQPHNNLQPYEVIAPWRRIS